jgi:hypothetical protein
MSVSVVAAPSVTWRIVPSRPPHLVRFCPRCDVPRPFASSGRFRVNACGRRLDVWLVYRCTVCDASWNLEIVERATPQSIGAARLAAYHRNDAALAWSCAFDASRLGRASAPIEPAPAYVERAPLAAGPVAVRLCVPFPVRIRLDRLLARQLGIPRSQLRALVHPASALRRPVFHGELVRIDVPVRGREPGCG